MMKKLSRLSFLFISFLCACAPRQVPLTDAAPTLISAAPAPTQAPFRTPAPTPEILAAPVTSAASLPNPASAAWVEVASGLNHPTVIAAAGDGLGRLFLVEQRGLIRIWQNGQLLPDPFLDIHEIVGSGGSEQGLLGLAFSPNFSRNGFFYVDFTDTDGNTRLVRYARSAENPNRADANSRLDLLKISQPYENHNGGALAFGPDAFLYVGVGDGGSGGDPLGNGQSLNTLLGKILRLDVDSAAPYAVPADNPFGGEIWAYGLRNPWKFSFDPATGDLFIGDVGQGDWEEVDYLPAGAPGGANFGWSLMEGTHPFNGADSAELTAPVAEYSHSEGCSVTGGVVYRGALPAWQGVYLYGDFCSGTIWGLLRSGDTWLNAPLYQTSFGISTFGQDESGEVYLADYSAGRIYRLEAANP
ncbi:MAG: PQQ-dependent sugar dehydrogenase [Anaerolineales bacterium]